MVLTDTITILGLGNLLCGDDAFGIHVVERLYSQFDFPSNVSVIDGGTQGHTLNCFVEESDKLLIVDAIDFNLEPGELSVFNKADVPVWLGITKMSPHQNSFSETLALASLRGTLPEEICLIGFQPFRMEFGSDITREALAKIPDAIQAAREILKKWGILLQRGRGEKHLLNSEMLKKINII